MLLPSVRAAHPDRGAGARNRGHAGGHGAGAGGSGGQTPDGGSPRLGEGVDVTNSVSLLQEYVQSCSSFSPHTKILKWSFQQRLEDASLQFRAVVSFVFRDVPHHFCGEWLTSKKKAQRDTAERVRHYLIGHCESEEESRPEPASDIEAARHELESVVACNGSTGAALDALEWDMMEGRGEDNVEPGRFQAAMSLRIGGIVHRFAGCWCESQEAARLDTAQRLLWYLGTARAEFEADERQALHRAAEPPPQASGFVASPLSSDDSSTPRQTVEDKTILMQVQNALQKTFARDTPPGQRVWVWSYEPDARDPQLFRAFVEVPSWGMTFRGDWCRGKKLAQRNACLCVKRHLDQRLANS